MILTYKVSTYLKSYKSGQFHNTLFKTGLEYETLRYVYIFFISCSIFSSVISLWMTIKQYNILARTCDEDVFLVVTGVVKGRWMFEPIKWSRLACGSIILAYLVAIYLLQGWTVFVCSILLLIAAIIGTEMLDSDSEKRWQTISFHHIDRSAWATRSHNADIDLDT